MEGFLTFDIPFERRDEDEVDDGEEAKEAAGGSGYAAAPSPLGAPAAPLTQAEPAAAAIFTCVALLTCFGFVQ